MFALPEQKEWLPRAKTFRRRTQMRMRCSQWTPRGRYVDPPGCCVEQADGFSAGPDVVLCDQGLHLEAPAMWTTSDGCPPSRLRVPGGSVA